MKSGEYNKIVLSRVLGMELQNAINYSQFFKALCNKNEDAFVYFLASQETGIWSGATPETLLRKENKVLETMSVAGTQLSSDYEKDPHWNTKEKEEQHMVSLYIEHLLSELGVKTYEVNGPITLKAGKVVHLKTEYSINHAELKNRIGTFIKGLHPTPAVCGLPKAEAFHLIEKAETHKRKLYTGFVGPWNLENKSHLFVNLRCAEFSENKIFAYIGGGLTAASIPKDEWQETKNKSRTILSVVERL
jgi:isochorismate synthase